MTNEPPSIDENRDEQTAESTRRNTPGQGRTPTAEPIEPSAPEEFGRVQAWWGDGKGKTTAALGMGFRAAGHGYRVHMLQFMKAGTDSVEPVRGEYNAIAVMPGFTFENGGQYGWHGMADGSRDSNHETKAEAGLERARELVEAARDVDGPLDSDAPPEDGCHMLILDELLYAADRDLVSPAAVISLITSKPDGLELVLTGSHAKPDYLYEHADLVTNVRKEKHPIESGQRARQGTEY